MLCNLLLKTFFFSSFVYIFWALFVYCFMFKSLKNLSSFMYIYLIFKIYLIDHVIQPLTY